MSLAYIWSPAVNAIGATLWALYGGADVVALGFSAATVIVRWGLVRVAVAMKSPVAAAAVMATGLPGLGLVFAVLRWVAPSVSVFSLTPRLLAIGAPAVIAYVAVLVSLAWSRLQARSHEGTDWAVVLSALWVAVPVMPMTFLRMRTTNAFMSTVHFSLIVVVPLVIALAAAVRIVLRRRWLRHVSAGLRPPWRVVQRDSLVGVDELPRLTDAECGSNGTVLVRVQELRQPFRDVTSVEPMGLVGHAA